MRHARALTRTLALGMLAILGGCVAAGHTSSPWEWGGGVRLAPGLWEVGDDGETTVHPTAGYTYLSFDGGHDSLWEFGAQVRTPVGDDDAAPWVGGEATFSHLRTSFDGSGISGGNSNGYSVTALFGKPVGDSRWRPNLYAGAGISDYGNQGWNIRVGLDFQPTFLWEN